MPDTQATQDARPRHPLDPLTPLEITQVVAIVRAEPDLPPSLLFEMIELMEPPKSVVRSFNPGAAFTRQARVNLFPSGDIGVWRLVVSLDEEKVDQDWRQGRGSRALRHLSVGRGYSAP